MDKRRERPTIEVKSQDDNDPFQLKRDDSLLPGMVRTPNFVVDNVSDWAAPGSTVWEEDLVSPKSQVTPLQPYGNGEWITTEENDEPENPPGSVSAAPFTTNATVAAAAVMMPGYYTAPSLSNPTPTFTVENGDTTSHSFSPASEEELVAYQIVASAGLPLSLNSRALQQFIYSGQPNHDSTGDRVVGSNRMPRNYPNQSDPEQDRGVMPSTVPHPSFTVRSGDHTVRPKSESEILSDLLHFHANYFPPPPPPRVPPMERRARAEVWYHYASKWDITHRLPPPPRTPIPEMELEFRMKLPEKTRVPYHGDGWLVMSERWFSVMQQLFDFPDENVGTPVDISIVRANAVTS